MGFGFERDHQSFPRYTVDYDLEGIVDLAVERTPSLREFQLAPVANQFMDRLLGLTWYDVSTQDHGVISTLWQEFVGGGGIGKPPDGALYGVGDSSLLCGAHRTKRSNAGVASLLTHREIHFSDPSGRIWSEDPFTGGYDDVMMEVMIPVRCGPVHRDTTLGHLIRGWVGASSVEHWSANGHGDA